MVCFASFHRIFRLASIAAGLVAFVSASAMAETVQARYAVHLIGLRIGEVNASGSIEPASYKIDLNARLTGLAAMVANVKMALASSGLIRRGTILPSAYATTSATPRETRTIRMMLDAGSVKAVEISPPLDDADMRIPVAPASKQNVLDPTSAFIMAVPPGEPLIGPAACNRTIPVYDGVVRFDITLSYVGTRTVSIKGYSGPVSVCAARYTPISGHMYDSKSAKFMAENREIEAWLAPIELAHVVVPFHVGLRTQAGFAEIDAVEIVIKSDRAAKTER
ncbi:MAG: DUF3108 domain-containing protein [Beijerinckiaceae bacterium]